MGVYINGMEMPKSCAECKLFGEYGCPFVGAVGYALTRGERNEDCPLVPVPPHGRLIDADALKKKHHWTDDFYETEYVEVEDIDAAPTIIPAEEVYGQYTDTAGNYHWRGTHSGEHTIKAEEGET